jgi:hypothetical protein
MITIGKSLTELDKLAKQHFRLFKGNPFNIEDALAAKLASGLPPTEMTFYQEVNNRLRDIITKKPSELETHRTILSPLYEAILTTRTVGMTPKQAKAVRKILNGEIMRIFDYDKFSRSKHAYDLAEKLATNVCLYCNRQYTFTLKGKTGKTRPQFDHFYDKGTNPYFAVSFYNLVPSCSICNSSLKGSDVFNIVDNFHPYTDNCDNVMSFRIDVKAVDFIHGKKTSFNILLEEEHSTIDRVLYGRARKNAETFKIVDLSNLHKDYVVELIGKSYYYNEEKLRQLKEFGTKAGNPLFSSNEEVLEFVLGNYIRQDKLGDRVLAKLTKDIAKQLGLFDLLKSL